MTETTLVVDRLTTSLPGIPAELLANFQENIGLALAGGLASSTIRGMRSDLRRFAAWCHERGVSWLPAEGRDVALFLEEMGRCGKDGTPYKPGTLDRFASSIRTLHQLAELPPPSSVKIKLVRKAHARQVGRLQAQATGLTMARLEPVLAMLDVEIALGEVDRYSSPIATDLCDAGLVARRDKALLLVGYCILARGSELLSLEWGDISGDGDGGTIATIRRSKVDQEGLGADQHLWPRVVDALNAWRKALDAEFRHRRQNEDARYQALWEERFRPRMSNRGRKRIHPIKEPVHLTWLDTPRIFRGLVPTAAEDGNAYLGWSTSLALSSLNDIIIARTAAAGLEGTYSSHSLRVGAAQDLVAAGKSLPAIMQDGRWKSPQMVLRYARKLLASRGAMAEMGRDLDQDGDTA